MDITYVGEHLWAGKTGNFFVVLSFCGALLSALSYFIFSQNEVQNASWKSLGRTGFYIHASGVLGIIGTLFYMLLNHFFEYHYVWQHSNTEMPMRYILSCFWEGQEGSFLLWTFWHVVLGFILIFTAKKWEGPVMAVVALVQIFLASMLLGVYVFGYKIGSNPFLLLRDVPDFVNLPFLQNENYLAKLDGRGLNPLLQNYWMTIHPPTLFLGFASTLVPFAYAIAGLWKKDFNGWMKPALPWTFFGVMILGTGILMGGAWAYEALSFGGFWAWDPVENASLVPWLTFVGAAHVMVIHKNKGQSLLITFVLTIITFILILYSTFLTRSGILGDSSVHAFTDLGMSGQLLVYLLTFLLLGIVLIVINWKHFPKPENEESVWSREFWMFVGAMVLSVSAFQIIFTTSIPVINKIFGSNIAPPTDPIQHYNSFQVWVAVIVALLIGVGQYFKFKKTEMNDFLKSISISFFGSIVITGLLTVILDLLSVQQIPYIILLFSSVFAITANASYFISVLKGRLKLSGASVAHVGFGMILLGALISMSKSELISRNTSGVDLEKLGEDFPNAENIMLVKNDTLSMGGWFVTYNGKKKEGVNVFYEIDYFSKDENGKYVKDFTLYPRIQMNPRMGNVAEPATKHYIGKDVYTHITYAELDEEKEKKPDEFKKARTVTLAPGDTVFGSNSIIIFEGLDKNVDKTKYNLGEKDIAVAAQMRVVDVQNNSFTARPVYSIQSVYAVPFADEITELGLKFIITKLIPESGKVELELHEKNSNLKEFIILKAIVFPGINILWAGCLIMVIGTVLAIRHRLKQSN
jgi:cytochrome c-type biogenesis protein CcmF